MYAMCLGSQPTRGSIAKRWRIRAGASPLTTDSLKSPTSPTPWSYAAPRDCSWNQWKFLTFFRARKWCRVKAGSEWGLARPALRGNGAQCFECHGLLQYSREPRGRTRDEDRDLASHRFRADTGPKAKYSGQLAVIRRGGRIKDSRP